MDRFPFQNSWFEACEKGDLSALKKLVEKGVDPNAASPSGRRALPMACREENLPLVKCLVGLGADPNQFSTFDGHPLASAVRIGSLPLVQYLLDRGAMPDAIDESMHWALLNAIAFSMPMFHLLLESGAKPDTATFMTGESALIYCVRFDRMDGLRALLDKGASIDAVDDQKRTPLMHACASQSPLAPQMVELLLCAGANPNHCAEFGWTPLMEAAAIGRSDTRVIDLLLQAGADVFAQARRGEKEIDALQAAMVNPGNSEIVDRLSLAASEVLSGATVEADARFKPNRL